jgi:hypothetical protein
MPQYSRDQRAIAKRLGSLAKRKIKQGQYQLLVVPDMGYPVLETTSNLPELATRLQKYVTDAADAYALNDYHFFAFSGESVEILIDEDLGQAVVKVGDQVYRPRTYSLVSTSLVDGRLPTANVVDVPAKGSAWDADEFDLG